MRENPTARLHKSLSVWSAVKPVEAKNVIFRDETLTQTVQLFLQVMKPAYKCPLRLLMKAFVFTHVFDGIP